MGKLSMENNESVLKAREMRAGKVAFPILTVLQSIEREQTARRRDCLPSPPGS